MQHGVALTQALAMPAMRAMQRGSFSEAFSLPNPSPEQLIPSLSRLSIQFQISHIPFCILAFELNSRRPALFLVSVL